VNWSNSELTTGAQATLVGVAFPESEYKVIVRIPGRPDEEYTLR
jgi:hypothetical protein